MTRYVLVFDIDGTLLHSDASVSPRLVQALRRAREDGHLLVVATGRRRKTAHGIARLFGIGDVPLVVCDGAVAFASGGDRTPIFTQPLPRAVVQLAWQTAQELGRTLALYTADDILTQRAEPGRMLRLLVRRGAYRSWSALRVACLDIWHRPRLLRRAALSQEDFYKGFFLGGGDSVRERLAGLVDFTMPGHGSEFVARGVSKATGLEAVLRHYRRNWGEVVAFGDNWNDLALLRRARFGFLMGNAPAELQRLHPRKTRSHDEDGVAVVLERLPEILGEGSTWVDG